MVELDVARAGGHCSGTSGRLPRVHARPRGRIGPVAVASDVLLPDEAPDLTASELHVDVLVRLFTAVKYALGERALVLMDIFLRVEGHEQVAPDLLVAPPAPRGGRKVYAFPDEPAPLVTVEVLSTANYEGEGRRALEAKRALFGRIGVPAHIELDPEYGAVAIWANQGGRLERAYVGTVYDGPELGGTRVEAPAPGKLHIYLPDGREVLDAEAEMARADAEAARAAAEAARADAEAARAARLAERLREAGIDPDQV
ncbi:MAG: Uma2 family endonuclease [Acidimicrobiales bacterium]